MTSSERAHSWLGTSSDNLTTLTELNEQTLLEAIQQRYHSSHIYTDVGDILVAVNPFRSIPLYGNDWSVAYSRPDVNSLAPHIYKVASRAYNAMLSEKKDQVCVISGESGAGKTESAKFIMHQVMSMCRSAGLGQKLQNKITQLNPVLEAFGNAHTALNDNSSRFGKYIQLVFEPNGRIIGAGLEQYLLEKSRVCVQGEKERNFHIFYYLYAGLSADMKRQFKLKEPTEHRYLNSYPNVVADCNSERSKESFHTVMKSMEAIGFAEEEIKSVLTILAGVILLGDIEFKGADSGDDNAEISNPETAELVFEILKLESCEDLCFALTKLRTETRGEIVDKCYTVTKAADVRDGLAKALYARMFQWIVSRLNGYLQPYPEPDQLNLGILDIFGFENFEQNSFEQFCINLANEQLQCYFNHQIFAMEKMELAKEGLEELDITFKDNKPVLDLFLTKPIGLLSLLDDQCRGLSGTEKGFIQKCKDSFGKHSTYVPHRGNALIFSVRHYAGDVEYQAGGFLEKNKDSLPDSVVSAIKYSSVRLIRTMFLRRSEHTAGSQLRKSILMKSQKSVMRAMSRRKSMKQKRGGKKLLTVSAHFRKSLDELMERLFAASPHFVRCLKPNLKKLPNEWCNEFMLKQLQYTGMLEAVRVRREGFAYRPFFSCFFNMYRSLAYYFTDYKRKGCEVACREILDKAGLENWKMGSSRVFLRYYHQEKLQLMLKDIEDKAILIQKTFRGFQTRKWTTQMRDRQKREKEMMTKFLHSMNEQGQECFPKIVALNRIDNLLAHERFANRRETAPLNRVDSYAGLDTQQKNRKRAKKLGIEMVPGLSDAISSKSRSSKDSEMEDLIPQILTESEDDEVVDLNIPMPAPRSRSSSNSSQPPPVPRPRSRILSSNLDSNRQSSDSTESQPVQVSQPIPIPRKRLSKPSDSSPKHLSQSDLPTGMTEPQMTTLEFPQDANQVPHFTLAVGGRKVLPEVSDSSSGSSTVSLEDDQKTKPVPKPRKSPTPSPRHIPRTSHSPGHLKPVDVNTLEYAVGDKFRQPLVSNDSDEISLDFHSSNRSTSPMITQCIANGDEQGESMLDFLPNSSAQRLKRRTDESSLDNVHTNSPRHRQDSELSVEGLYERRPSMADNLLNLRLLANSMGNLYEEGDDPKTKRYSNVSSSSALSDNMSPRGSFSEQPPQADKRTSSGRRGFGFGKKKFRNRSRLGSTKSLGGSSNDLRFSSVSSDGGETTDFLGFYPNLDQATTEEFVLGQPCGTFAVCKEDTSSTTCEESGWTHTHNLVLSLGRSVHVIPIITTTTFNGDQFHLDNVNSLASFSFLRELVEFYRTTEVVHGVCLLQPRLLAGVYVSSPNVTPRKPPITPRKRLAKRRKHSKPTTATEIEALA